MNADFDITNVVLTTERLLLRPWQLSDQDDFYEYASVEGVGEMAGWPHHETIEKTKEIIKRFIEEKKTFAIVLKENNKVIGSLGIENIEHHKMLSSPLKGREIGYVLAKDYWGKGYMPEAGHAVVDYCFQHLGYDFLLCGYFQWNNQSRRVCEKLGFKFFDEILFETRMGSVEKTNLCILYNNRNS